MDVLFIRHAQSENNARPEPERVEDPPLTALGHRQAVLLATKHPRIAWADVILTSPFLRALQTADILCRYAGCRVEVWRDLHEQGGCYSGYLPGQRTGRPGLTGKEIASLFPQFTIDGAIGDGGWWESKPYEEMEEAHKRARAVIARLEGRFANRRTTVAVVTHADFLRAILTVLTPAGFFPEQLSESIYNTSVTLVRWQSAPSLICWNTVDHLPQELRTT